MREAAVRAAVEGRQNALAGRRIAVLNWKDPWHPEAGGAEAYAWRMCRHLVGLGALVTFATARPEGHVGAEIRDGIPIVRGGGRLTVYLWMLWWLFRHRRDFDAVIDCQNGIPFFSPWVLPRRTPVVCIVHHVHDKQFDLFFGPMVARFGKWLEGPASCWSYRKAVTVAVSPSTVTAMRERLSWRGPVVVVPNGMTTPMTAEEHAARERASAPVLLCVGRIAIHKRVDRLLDVVDDLRDTWPGLSLHVVGDGPGLPALREAVAERGMQDEVVLHGFLPTAERDALVRRAWLHLSASLGEGWGLVVLEAARAGLPTLAYDVDGLRDAVRNGETGWLVPAGGDFSASVDEALRVLSDPSRSASTAWSCRRWASMFSWHSSGDRLAAILTDLLEPGPAAWGEESLVAVADICDWSAVERVRKMLPSRCWITSVGAQLRVLAPAASVTEVRTALEDAGIDADSVTIRAAGPAELLGGYA